MSERPDPAALLRVLREADVDYVVIGGLAVIAYGVQRFTKDVDVCPSPKRDSLERLAGVLTELEATHLGASDFDHDEFPFDPRNPDELAEGGNFRLATRLGVLDLMQWIPGIEAEHAYPVLAPEATPVSVFGAEIRICSLEHLRLMKRAADRPQDRLDLEQLAIARGDER
ncbi:MAG: nucleotidyltransferase [Thermoleophilaceae bacterium]|nr:nucleotidyltransferase [Thermoleophilaceae bacterium]